MGEICGGDLPRALKFCLKNPKTVCESLCLNAPDKLEEELLQAFREACPTKSLSYMPIDHATML